jgi:hypothetical protein
MIKCMKKPDSIAPDPAQNAAVTVAVEPADAVPHEPVPPAEAKQRPREIGGPSGLEPTRYGDWERNGRVSDF